MTSKPIDTRVEPHVRIENAALDEDESSASGLVMRGRIAPSTLRFLKVDQDYQRGLEIRQDIENALRDGKVLPDIDIGVRGQAFDFDGDDCIIKSPAFIIDGWQRVGNAIRLLDEIGDIAVRLGALVHFSTDAVWEAQRFTDLNNNAKRVSTSLHLRNLRYDYKAVLTLYGITRNEPNCPLNERVCWDQRRRRGDLMSATILARSCMFLHGHKAPVPKLRIVDLCKSLEAASRTVSLNAFRGNCLTFLQLVEDCWGIRSIEYARAAPQIKASFLSTLARLLSRHRNFWTDDGNVLAVDRFWRNKLARFPINDPQVAQLAGSQGMSQHILYDLLHQHLSRGMRTNRLLPWHTREAA